MIIKKDKKVSLTVKEAFVEMGKLVDVETGESLNLTDIIPKVFGDSEVKIVITATASEEVELESEDSEE